MTITALAAVTDIPKRQIYSVLRSMPDIYIDRWDCSGAQVAAVWCAALPPKDCPRPEGLSVNSLSAAA
jgi:hypothetical protein